MTRADWAPAKIAFVAGMWRNGVAGLQRVFSAVAIVSYRTLDEYVATNAAARVLH